MEFPKKCPYCGKDINPEPYNISRSSTNKLQVYFCNCEHCKEPIVITENYGEIVNVFPNKTFAVLPNRIQKLSHNACKAFEQALQAKSLDLDFLVGAGLRIALEWLVWDYLVSFKQVPEDEIKDLTLKKRIDKMNTGHYAKICAKLIRLFGNDEIHIIKMLNFSVDTVISAFYNLCNLIASEIEICEINEQLED